MEGLIWFVISGSDDLWNSGHGVWAPGDTRPDAVRDGGQHCLGAICVSEVRRWAWIFPDRVSIGVDTDSVACRDHAGESDRRRVGDEDEDEVGGGDRAVAAVSGGEP